MPSSHHLFSRRQTLTAGAGVAAAAALTAWPAHARADANGRGAPRGHLLGWARDTWRSMAAMTHPYTGLVSDNIDATLKTNSRYTSPTNLGGYLWSCLVSRELHLISARECSRRIAHTLTTLTRMEHHTASGMYFNWYDPADGSVITAWPDSGDPVVPFVSSVDAAWLGAALLCVRNGDRANARLAGRLFDAMRFEVFADPTFARPYLNYGGFYLVEPTALNNPPATIARDLIGEGKPVWYTANHHYDTTVSETRITTYLGIIKGQVPASAYYQTWRTFPPDWTWPEMPPVGATREYQGVSVYEGAHRYGGLTVVPGWGGSMFEELMPNVFVPEQGWAPRSWGHNHPAHVDAQIHHGMVDAKYGYWGFSPSSNPAGGYSEYGVDALGLNPEGYYSDNEHTNYVWNDPPKTYGDGVVTPHASFLAMMHRPTAAQANLRKLTQNFDAYGRGGFYDAIAVRSGTVAKRYLSLDQAMSLGALGNVLANNVLQRYFCSREVVQRLRPVLAPEIFGP